MHAGLENLSRDVVRDLPVVRKCGHVGNIGLGVHLKWTIVKESVEWSCGELFDRQCEEVDFTVFLMKEAVNDYLVMWIARCVIAHCSE